ncbi:hypothetical protein [Sulfitobacter aestuariivivens]|uniref:hypothetical protein n=1 Tax=Sulfitobacter aestuariivivens TaxID=2766981 RepID=UPI00360FE62E
MRVYTRLKDNLSSRFGLQPLPETTAAARGEARPAPSVRDPLAPFAFRSATLRANRTGHRPALALSAQRLSRACRGFAAGLWWRAIRATCRMQHPTTCSAPAKRLKRPPRR